MVFFSLCFI